MGRGRNLITVSEAAVRNDSNQQKANTPMPPLVLIPMSFEEFESLSTLMDVADDRDPIVGWEYPDTDDYQNFPVDDDYYQGPIPVRGDRADYAQHPLLPVVRAIHDYTQSDYYPIDVEGGVELAVKTDVNHDIFIDELAKTGRYFRVQSSV